MPVPATLVHVQSTTTGTGSFTCTPVNGRQTFATAFGVNSFDYFASNQAAPEWERGRGHMSDPTTLSRDVILESSNSGNPVFFSSGQKDITNDVPAQRQIYNAVFAPGLRLTLSTGVPVPPAQTAIITAPIIYLTAQDNTFAPLFDGSDWSYVDLGSADLSLALDSNTGHQNYHQSGGLYDIWLAVVSGQARLGTGSKWTDGSTRAADSDVQARYGLPTNKNALTFRYGPNSGDIATVPINQALNLGVVCMSANGQTEDSLTKRLLWNRWNPEPRPLFVTDPAINWFHSAAVWRQANANANNKVAFVRGSAGRIVQSRVETLTTNNAGQFVDSYIGIGLGSVTPVHNRGGMSQGLGKLPLWAEYVGDPGLGYRELWWLENAMAGVAQYQFGTMTPNAQGQRFTFGLSATVWG